MSQECRCFLLTLQRYDNFPSKTSFLQIFVRTTCDTAAHLRQSAEIAPQTVASVANRFPFEIVIECEQAQMEIAVPEILQCLDLIDSRRLPVLLSQRQVIDVGLTSDETLQYGGIGILCNLQRALGIAYHRLPLVNLCHGLHDIQFGVASLLLTLVRSRLSLTLCREPGIALFS